MNEKIQTFTILIFSIHNKNYNLGTIILLHILLGTLWNSIVICIQSLEIPIILNKNSAFWHTLLKSVIKCTIHLSIYHYSL